MTTLPRTETPRETGVVLMMEPGRYEWSGVLLVSSLLAFAYDDIGIWVYCRRALIDQLHPTTREFLDRHGVTLAPIDPQFEVIYPQGNKLYACAAPRNACATVLMDTDMMLVRPVRLGDAVRRGAVSGRMTSGWMWGKTVDEWQAAYASVGLAVPRQRMHRPDGSYVPVSLAAAFVAYEDLEFGAIWRDVALEIEAKRLCRGIYPTLDQISLPVAAVKAGLRPNPLDAVWNKGGVLKDRQLSQVNVHHYQKADTLRASPNRWIADAVLGEFSPFSSLDAMIAFYEAEGAKPAEVDGNAGYWRRVRRAQHAVDERHSPAPVPHPAKGQQGA